MKKNVSYLASIDKRVIRSENSFEITKKIYKLTYFDEKNNLKNKKMNIF